MFISNASIYFLNQIIVFFETVEKNESNNHVENKKEFLIHLIHHIDELESYPKEEHLQAAWIAMDMLQNFRKKLV